MGTFCSTYQNQTHILFSLCTLPLTSPKQAFPVFAVLLAGITNYEGQLLPHPTSSQSPVAANFMSKLFLDSVTSMTALIHNLLISHLTHCKFPCPHSFLPPKFMPLKMARLFKNTNLMTFLLFRKIIPTLCDA